MTTYPDHIREEALGWLVRTNDPEFDRWDEFSAWLERDPVNADAYHALAASEVELRPWVETVTAPQPAVIQRRSGRRPWAIAASVAFLAAAGTAIVAPRLMPGESRPGCPLSSPGCVCRFRRTAIATESVRLFASVPL